MRRLLCESSGYLKDPLLWFYPVGPGFPVEAHVAFVVAHSMEQELHFCHPCTWKRLATAGRPRGEPEGCAAGGCGMRVAWDVTSCNRVQEIDATR